MSVRKKLDGLKMTYLGQASPDGTGNGGVARVKTMTSLFKRFGIKIDLISYSFHSEKLKIEHKKVDPSLQITTIHVPNKLPKFLKIFAVLPAFIYAWKSCKNSELIFADFIGVPTSLPAIVLRKIFNKPLILDYIDVSTGNVIEILHKLKYARNADLVFTISSYLTNKAKAYGCKNIVYLPNFVDTNLFNMSINARREIRGSLKMKDDEIVIGYAGAFWYVEGVPFLLQAFKNLKRKHSNIKLAIMGEIKLMTDDKDNIPKLVESMELENDVILIPSQPHEDVPKFLSAFDILCCPKIDCEINRAANPIKVPEYLSMGLPTVCSAVGGIIDTIEDGVNGFLVEPGNIEDLEEKLEWVILNPERSKEIGENGRKTAIEKYSYEAIEDAIRQAISEIVDMKKGKKELK